MVIFFRFGIGNVLAQTIDLNITPTITLQDPEAKSMGSAKIRRPIHFLTKLDGGRVTKKDLIIEIANDDNSTVETRVVNSSGKKIDAVIEELDVLGKTVVTVNPPTQFVPGKYKFVAIDQTGAKIEQDFLWGVLALNPNKAVYRKDETGNLSIAVLDEEGKMVCDAKVKLRITNYQSKIDEELSTENGKILVNPECLSKDFTLIPDYETKYKFTEYGQYNLELTAITANGTYTINDQIEVKNNSDFEVERVSATRIFPENIYPVTVKVKANRDFEGTVEEQVPVDFLIKTDGEVVIENNVKYIRWQTNLKRGKTAVFEYTYDAPDVSPQFYLLGPLIFSSIDKGAIYTEERQWQVAVDDTGVAKIRQEINIIDGVVTVGGTDAAMINIDTTKYNGATYYFEVVANYGAGATLTVNLSTGNIQSVGIGITNGTTIVRTRKQFTPETGSFDYRLNVVTGGAPSIKAARVIILQSANSITNTQTQIEIGNLEIGLSMATTAPLTSPKYWTYTANNWDTGTTFTAEVTYKQSANLAAGSTAYAVAGTFNLAANGNVRSLTVEAWGAGGGGGNRTTTGTAGGGGGGAFAVKNNYILAAGVGLTVTVGIGRSATNGGVSFVSGDGTTFVSASGGIGVTTVNIAIGGIGGLTTNSIGDTKWAGGIGASGVTNGGGGGGGAGDAGNGGNANTNIGGTGGIGIGTSGGKGGNGATSAANGTAGTAPGGGGGGARRANSGTYYGGAGAAGRVEISWPAVNFTTTIYLQQDNGSFANWTNVATIVNGGTAIVPTHVSLSSPFTPIDGRHYRIVSNINNSWGTFNIYNAKIVATQSTKVKKLEPQYLLLNTKSTSIGATLGYSQLWDSTEWLRVTNSYRHAIDTIGAGTTASVKLRDVTASGDLTNSGIGGTNQVISSGITMPTSGNIMDTWIVGAGLEVDASRILVQVSINDLIQINQSHFRWKDDSAGLNVGGTWLSAEDGIGIGTTISQGTVARLRLEIAANGDVGVTNANYQLEYGFKAGGSCGTGETYTAVVASATTQQFEMAPTTKFSVGDTTSTGLLTATGIWTNGYGIENPGTTTPALTLNAGYYTELEYAIRATTNASDNSNYCFRVTNAGSTADMVYTVYPQLTVKLTNLAQATYRFAGDDAGVSGFEPYTKPVVITNGSGTTLTDFQVAIDTDTSGLVAGGKMGSDCGDIRLMANDQETPLSYWIESGCNTSSTRIWVKVPILPNGIGTTVYMFYGNVGITTTGVGSSTFLGFDDFSGSSLGVGWTTGAGTWNISGGTVSQTDTAGTEGKKIFRNIGYTGPVSVQAKMMPLSYGSDGRMGVTTNIQDGSANDPGVNAVRRNNDDSICVLIDTINWWCTGTLPFAYNIGSWYMMKVSSQQVGTSGMEYAKTWPFGSTEPPQTSSYGVGMTSTWTAFNPTNGVVGLNGGFNSTVAFDYWFARKYVSTEPTVSVGSEISTSTKGWLAAENVGLTSVSLSTNYRVRFAIDNVGGGYTPVGLRLQVAPKGGAANCGVVDSGSFNDVPGSVGTSVAVMATSSFFTDQDATTNWLTPAATTFIPGNLVESTSNQTNTINLLYDTFTEAEYNFQMTNVASYSTTYCLRTINVGTSLNTYTNVATLTTTTAPSGGPTMDQLMRHGGWFNSELRQPFTF